MSRKAKVWPFSVVFNFILLHLSFSRAGRPLGARFKLVKFGCLCKTAQGQRLRCPWAASAPCSCTRRHSLRSAHDLVLLLQKVGKEEIRVPPGPLSTLHSPVSFSRTIVEAQLQTGASGARAVRLEAHAVVPDGELAEGAPAVELDAIPSRLAGGKGVFQGVLAPAR